MARVPYLTPTTADPAVAPVLAQLEARSDATPILRAVAHSRGAFRNFFRLASALLVHTRLDARLRELAILRVAAPHDPPYVWEHHLPWARDAGCTAAEIAALRQPTLPDGVFSEADRAVIRFADETAARRLSDAAFADVQRRLGDEATVDLVLTVAWFAGMDPIVVEALGLDLALPPDAPAR